MAEETKIPTVSVIIATYNRDKFIGEAVQSILNQTYKDFEIIIVDDGSNDSTKEIIASLKDPRINYYYQENKGRSKARNKALELARGKYITFLDSDDLYLPNKLEIQVDYMEKNSDIYMIYTSAYCIDEVGNSLKHKYEAKTSGRIYKDIAFFVPVTITLPTVMVRREVFEKAGNFDEVMYRFEDTDMWRRISKHYEIGAISEFTCKLRTHSDNHLLNQDPVKIASALKYYSLKILNEDQEYGIPFLEKNISNLYIHYGQALQTVQEFASTGDELIRIAKMLNPDQIAHTVSNEENKQTTCGFSAAFYHIKCAIKCVYRQLKSILS
ncbi:MAG TPA: glycosyltransferase [Rickettsia endosymbiont of Pyrocoelia pectoralis]|nr:glycosyltransferase [Rickettsia endosymbiont of Pyrocoelia pectoralis]